MARQSILASLLLLALFFLLEVSAAQVGLFSDPRYTNQFQGVDGTEARGSAVMLEFLLEQLEHDILKVEDADNVTQWQQVLSSVSIFVFPEVDDQPVAVKRFDEEELPEALKEGLESFVTAGGLLIWSSNALLFNKTFELGWQPPSSSKRGGGSFYLKREADTEGTAFAEGPEQLEDLDGVQAPVNWEGDEGAVCYYSALDGEDQDMCAVLSIAKGQGFMVYLAWDFNSLPSAMAEARTEERDFITEAWEQVFNAAVQGPWESQVTDSSSEESSSSPADGSLSSAAESGAAVLQSFFLSLSQ